jgi:hypothetical protein
LIRLEIKLEKQYKMSYLGLATLYIGVEFIYFLECIMIIQHKYVEIILRRFQMSSYHFVTMPMDEGAQLLNDIGLGLIDGTKDHRLEEASYTTPLPTQIYHIM